MHTENNLRRKASYLKIHHWLRASPSRGMCMRDHPLTGVQQDLFNSIRIGEISITKKIGQTETVGAGSYFGELSLLNKIPRVATAEVVSDWARIIIVSDTQMKKILAEDHQVSMHFLSNMARKLQLNLA